MIKRLESISDYESLRDLSVWKIVFIIKHSTACPVSANGYGVFVDFFEKHKKEDEKSLLFGVVIVQTSRDVSNFIEKDTGIKHESPQVLVFKDGKAIWNDSHYGITLDALEDVLKK